MKKNIPVTKSVMPSFNEYSKEIRNLWDNRWLTNMGIKHNKLIKKLKKFFDTDNVDLVVNGHNALELAIEVLELKGEVITTPFTFVSTINAISRKGLTPVFCDIDEETCTIDVNKIEELITKKTCAIMPVHVYGNVCDVDAIKKIAKKYNLKVIYDAAHAFGVEYKGKNIVNYGDISCMSFHATKAFHTIEGGCIISKNPKHIKKINTLKDFGIVDEERINAKGTNAKMNEFCAAMGLCNLKHFNENIRKRKQICDRYRKLLNNINGLKMLPIQKNIKSNYAYFPIFIDKKKFGMDRNELKNKLDNKGIYTRKYFYPAINDIAIYKNKKYRTPIAHKLSKQVLALPLYPELSLKNVDYICNNIASYKRKKK